MCGDFPSNPRGKVLRESIGFGRNEVCSTLCLEGTQYVLSFFFQTHIVFSLTSIKDIFQPLFWVRVTLGKFYRERNMER